jgi:hypothetical protein
VPADFKLITYEDMKADTRRVMQDITAFLCWPKRGGKFLETVVRTGRFDNMRKIEETNLLNNPRLKPPEDGDPEGFKVRKGKVGGYTDYLTDEDIRYVDDYLRDNLDDYFSFYKS